ncbi:MULTISPECIES: type III-A CRISPR-associated CARF protein Csm6 [Mammaliicoccus]|uniref:Type III-A CRISPR-associated CARF protein Csm6 n=1 Tax=Mammaliicoccus sciuri TaxID=1296 RepID=A0AAW5LKC8_MAMSC|nr:MULTISPECIES: type III-A CRISPR-associated CARF protein Csm6 [Mammaliicoccus]MBG9211670.1 type III-A CRISPR-associated protein Csm6 [Mammaliicoccus sciuri]MCD5140045.1 type III-A CRISPR-associated protein Csm6 [Mammaliicoccus sciuri]MCQ9303487.1 type III-A CRISPR-associated CARF protein Csm6 [Mammaliicoccus sciuri]WQL33281.1 type III-A CRISPR-associated CARF protein Csm6 [Mammaliicoccus sciuri]WQL60219.1 type III-A CRISPR-associated CARF protein Csm6 [Mammaliicoccus sciuri]
MSVLFSPVGNSDPWRSGRDGAMLHIIRHYKPKKVVLFFTESLWEGNDIRYGHKNYDWETIIHAVSPNTEVSKIIRKIDNAQDFDSFKEEFHYSINTIEQQYPEEEILLNVTSGTPQMEATLCLEYIVYPDSKKCIQVSTPEKSSNANLSYANPQNTLEQLENVNHNESLSEARFKEIEIISFREAMIRSQLLSLIDNYDYEGALNLINLQKSFRNKRKLVQILDEITQNIKTHKVFPDIQNKYSDETQAKLLFHFLLLQMRYNRGDIAEFLIRVKSIAEYIAEYQLNQKHPNIIEYKRGMPKLNSEESSFLLLFKRHMKENKMEFKIDNTLGLPAYVHIFKVLDPNSTFTSDLDKILKINGLRNSVAHRLEAINVTDKSNKKTLKNSMNSIKSLLEIVFPNINQGDYDYFENKNEEIRNII